MTDHGTSPQVFRDRYVSHDLGEVEEFLCGAYTEVSMQLPDDPRDFEFRHETVATSLFSISRVSTTLAYTADAEPLAGRIIASPRTPSPLVFERRGHVPVAAVDDTATLIPTWSEYSAHVHQGSDVDLIVLSDDAVDDYAEATTSLPAGRLAMSGLSPISPAMNEHLRATVAHVRDDVLNDPFAATSPILLDSAFRTIAAALLSTYPNTALAAVTDPDGPGVRGGVPSARLREIIDYIDTHADQPIGPANLAELAGVPAREVVEGLRRYRDVHPSELLWTARMRGVRRDLHESGPDDGSVAAIAARWGFGHLGRFGVAYTHLFGERPEDTLRG